MPYCCYVLYCMLVYSIQMCCIVCTHARLGSNLQLAYPINKSLFSSKTSNTTILTVTLPCPHTTSVTSVVIKSLPANLSAFYFGKSMHRPRTTRAKKACNDTLACLLYINLYKLFSLFDFIIPVSVRVGSCVGLFCLI